MRLYIRLLTILLLFPLVSTEAKENIEVFVHYTSTEGLSSDNIHDIAQDKHGFIWIATQYGLSRFDGQYFKNFLEKDYPSLLRNDFYHAYLLPNKEMTFAGGVIVSYNEETDSFDDLSENTQLYNFTSFSLLKDQNVIVTSDNDIFSYDSQKKKIHPLWGKNYSHRILDFWQDPYGRYWIGSDSGIFLLNKDGSIISKYEFMSHMNEMINNILPLDENHVFLCSTVGSLWLAEIDKNGHISPPTKMDTPFRNVSEALHDSNGQFWFGTLGNGLWKMSYSDDGKFLYRKIIPNNSNGEELSKISSLFEDSKGNIWIGTQNFGVWCLLSKDNIDSYTSTDLGLPKVKGSSFNEDENGNILFGTDGNGLFCLSHDYKIWKHYSEKDGLPCNNILDIKKAKNKFLLSFWGGNLSYLNCKTKSIERVIGKDMPNPLSRTKSVLINNDNEIWAGTAGDGIYKQSNNKWNQIQLKDTSMEKHPDVWINRIYQSSNGNLWILSSRTVWVGKEGHFRSVYPDIDKVPSNNPLSMNDGVCDSAGNFFVATNKGILKFSPDGSFYEWLSFLPKEEYLSILIDKNNNLWTSGTNGIISFNYQEKKYKLHAISNQYHGNDYFAERASFLDSEGRFFFGCKDGFVVFETKEAKKDSSIGYFAFSELYLLNKKINPGTDILPTHLNSLEELKVKHNYTNMTITFDLIDFSRQNNVKLSYRIVELDSAWIDLGPSREIKIAHLPADQYRLEIKAEKYGEKQLSKTISLIITVLPPWWATWWFRSIIILFVLLIISSVLFIRFRNIIRQRELLQVLVSERTSELNEANLTLQEQKKEIEKRNDELVISMKNKDQFISIVAHDLKNPMFAIVSALKGILNGKEEEKTKEKVLQNVYQSANTLQTEMIRLLDWATAQQSNVVCQPQDTDLKELTLEVISLLHGMADDKQIRIDLNSQLKHYAYVDVRMVSTILRNVLTNAIKFTPHRKSIKIELAESSNEICIRIKDSGSGMTEEQRQKLLSSDQTISSRGTDNEIGFGLGFRIIKDFVSKNNGRLGIESLVGEGTSIIIYLPASENALNIFEEKLRESNDSPIKKDLLSGKSILIVDDDPLILLHLRTILQPYVSIIEAKNGIEGIEEAKKNIPDLIVSDVEMPEMDGIEMFRTIKENTHTSNIPLLFLSANNSTNERLSGLSYGAIDYIAKPFDEKEFILKICNILLWQRNQQVQILANTYNNDEETKNEQINPLLKQLLDVIKENYTQPDFSFDDIAQALGMSKSTLSRRLKSLTDKSPVEILSEYRLNKAKQLLKDSTMTISEVAYSVGFNDPLYFSRKYKENFGITPSEEKG